MSDPNLILTLTAMGNRATRALDHANGRLHRKWKAPRPEQSDRESTADTHDGDEIDASPSVEVRFDQKPKNMSEGFVFGSDPMICDVLLGFKKERISRRHFRISFDKQKRPILENTSDKFMAISYSGQCVDQARQSFRWILFTDNAIIVEADKDIGNRRESLTFKVELAGHNTCQQQYQWNLDSFVAACQTSTFSLSQLDIQTQESTAGSTDVTSPKPGPIYLKQDVLGSGLSGTVHRAVDVSNGNLYAAKVLKGDIWLEEVNTLRRLSHVRLRPS